MQHLFNSTFSSTAIEQHHLLEKTQIQGFFYFFIGRLSYLTVATESNYTRVSQPILSF